MHKYQPRIHLVRLKPGDRHHHTSSESEVLTPQLMTSSPETISDLELTSDSVVTFVFPETMFTAVTAYQNQLVNLHDISFLCLGRQGRLAGGDLDLSVCPSVCSSVTKFVKRYFENEWTHFGTNGPRGTHARNDQLWRLEVKRQGHTRPKINLEAWRSSFSTLLNEVDFLFYCKTNVVRILPWLRRSRRRQR